MMNPRSLPQLECGQNAIAFSKRGNGDVRVSYAWTPREGVVPPIPPVLASPFEGEVVQGTRPQFEWVADARNTVPISQYQIQVSSRPDMRWPISALFDAMVTAREGSDMNHWSPPYAGRLNPGQSLYWRVRNKSTDGIWSAWSGTRTFRCLGPGTPIVHPLERTVDGGLVLAWSPGTIGTRPDHYRVYGSNIRGFEPSDTAYTLLVGNRGLAGQRVLAGEGPGPVYFDGPHWWDYAVFDQNLFRVTNSDSIVLPTRGSSAAGLLANYRIIAVDEAGHESPPSELVTLPTIPWDHSAQDTIFLRNKRSVADTLHVVLTAGNYLWNEWNPGWWGQEQIMFSLSNAPPWMSIGTATGILSGIPDDADTVVSYTIQATGSGKNAIREVPRSLSIAASNHVPRFTTLPPLVAVEDVLFESQLHATDPDSSLYGDAAKYRVASGPSWVSVDSITGRFWGTPRIHDVRDTIVLVQAFDPLGGQSEKNLAFTIRHVNHVPTFPNPMPIITGEGSALSLDFRAFDVDTVLGERLRYSLEAAPRWVKCDQGSGSLSGMPTASDVGSSFIYLHVIDDSGATASVSLPLTVVHVNHAPVFATTDKRDAIEDQPFALALHASDVDSALFHDRVRYALDRPSSWLSIDPVSGILSGRPTITDLHDSLLTIIATDDSGATDRLTLTIPVRHVNHAPAFAASAAVQAAEDTLCRIAIHAVDTDTLVGDRTRYRMLFGPGWLTLDTLHGIASGIPGAGDVGSGSITMIAVDDSNATATSVIPFSVRHTNHAPVVVSLPAHMGVEDSLYASRIIATDADVTPFGDRLRYTAVLKPAWLSLDSLTGILTGIPRAGQLFDTTLAVVITDGNGGTALASTSLLVAHTNHPPVFATLFQKNGDAVEDTPFSMTVAASDGDTPYYRDSLTYDLTTKPVWLSINHATGLVYGTPREGDHDTLFTVRVSDGITTSSTTVDLPVTQINDPPTLVGLSTLTLAEDSSVTLDLPQFVRDPDDAVSAMSWDIATTSTDTRYRSYFAEGGPQSLPSTEPDSLVVYLDTTSARISIVARRNFFGSNIPVVVSVHDPAGLSTTDTLLLTVLPVNDPPVLSGMTGLALNEDDSLLISMMQLNALVTDPDDPDSLLSWHCSSTGGTRPHWTPKGLMMGLARDWSGTDSVTIRVTDRDGCSDSIRVAVNARPVNDPPVIARMPDILLRGDSTAVIGLARFISDVDDSASTLYADIRIVASAKDGEETGTAPEIKGAGVLPVQLTIDRAENLTVSVAGSFRCSRLPVVLRVFDANGAECADTLFLTVMSPDRPPVILAGIDTVAVPGKPYTAYVHVQRADSDDIAITYTLQGPGWLSIDSTGKISGTPSTPSEDSFLVVATDQRGASDSLRFKLVVRATPVSDVPADYVLYQNYPNPFNPSTTIRFGLPEPSHVTAEVYNIIGQRVATLLAADLQAGYHDLRWSPSSLASGMYLIVVQTRGLVSWGREARLVQKVSLVR